MAKSNPDVYLALGDLSYAGPDSAPRFCRLVRSKVGPDAPFEIVSGNHEEDTGGDGLIADFAKCLPDRLNAVGEYGQDHTYQRSKQISAPRAGCKAVIIDRFDRDCVVDEDDSYEKGAGSAFVISGAGGGKLYPLHDNDPEAGYFAATMGKNSEPRHGFAMLTISPQALRVKFVGSIPGLFEDRFEIVNE